MLDEVNIYISKKHYEWISVLQLWEHLSKFQFLPHYDFVLFSCGMPIKDIRELESLYVEVWASKYKIFPQTPSYTVVTTKYNDE